VIEAKKVCLRYPDGTLALKNIDLQIKTGELVYVTGESGSGKTSLLKLLMGMEFPTAGTLKVLGRSVSKDQAANIRQLRQLLGPVFQDFKLVKGRSVLENVMLGLRFLGLSPGEIRENAQKSLVKVALGHKTLAPVDNLSWGECQRLAIARAIARKPALILADEPTGNLDKDHALNILDILASFKDNAATVIITTHATHLIDRKKAARIINLNKGSIDGEGREISHENYVL